jgi:ATP-dependent DNA helicase RecQ
MTYTSILKDNFGYDSFRFIQEDIINSIGSGHDTIGLMPTGGGKSITFQVPALAMDGMCLVISPLIALMQDQMEHLKARGIKAEAIYTGKSRDEIQRILDNAVYGAVKFLYVAPERLSSSLFLAKLQYINVSFIVVDEAHCISQWGHEFRPAYLCIKEIRKELPNCPVLALTATATAEVIEDIKKELAPPEKESDFNVFTMSFRRPNLRYVVRHTNDKIGQILNILQSVDGSAIVYTRSREKTKELAQKLQSMGIKATFYHAGLDFSVKNKHQQLWHNGDIRVIVATNAFGMGIDKPDVRIVIHADVPDSIEAYYQEAGRAGRDGKNSYAVLLYDKRDKTQLMTHLNEQYPTRDYISKVYDSLAYFFQLAVEDGEGATYVFDEERFCTNFHFWPATLHGALHILQNAGYIEYDEAHNERARVIMNISRHELNAVNGLSKTEENVLTRLLRYYGTLFSDFTYIDELLLSRRLALDESQLHIALKSMAEKKIIRYAAARTIPVIYYTRQRCLSEKLYFPKESYENLRSKAEQRIGSMIDYLETDKNNEEVLLRYFGEKI